MRSVTRASSSGASHGCIATLRAGRPEADLLFTLPKQADWDLGVLTRYIRHTHPPVQRDMLIGSVRRRGGAWGAIALVGPGRGFDREDRRLIARIAAVLSAAVHRIDRDRLLGVRDRIDRKIMEQIHPKDLFYQILDGIRSLTLVRSFVGAPHPRRGRGIAARGGGTDRVDESQERADRTADSDHR